MKHKWFTEVLCVFFFKSECLKMWLNLRAVYWSRFLEISNCLLALNTMAKTVHPLLLKSKNWMPGPAQ
jgi:hypothetical protein